MIKKIMYLVFYLGLFSIFVYFVLFINYEIALIIGDYCLKGINFIAGRDDFYKLGGRGVAMGMYLSFSAIPMCGIIVSLVSLLAYFIKRINLSCLIACIGFILYCCLFSHYKLYFFIVYYSAFFLALCEIKASCALQNYMKISIKYNEK